MSNAKVYSQRLGEIADEQFEAACERLGIGNFVRATRVATGLFGQNVFVSTSEGEFVLRGAPHWVQEKLGGEYVRHDFWQFTKESHFAKLLHEKTRAQVPWPMLFDNTNDIFGWPYLMMPRMPGICFSDKSANALSAEERLGTARALGHGLAEQQQLQGDFAGDFDFAMKLAPYPGGHASHLVRETTAMAGNARKNGRFSTEDDDWLNAIFERARARASTRASVYLHGDYKFNNLTLKGKGAYWTVSGVFDLHESRFGDGASDLFRQISSWLDFRDEDSARAFLAAYRDHMPADPTLAERTPLYVANDRMKFWDYFTRPEVNADWLAGKTFKNWCSSYITAILALLE
jgi:aminoglycoside phosphotransferase (APT) family kinase protein